MIRFIKLVLIVSFSILYSAAGQVVTDINLDKEKKQQFAENRDLAMATVQFMNHINYVVYTLSAYKNVFVIEDEYRKLSPGNLDLNKIPDDDVRRAIEHMLERINDLRLKDKERDRFLRGQERLAQAAKETMWKDIVFGLVSDGLPAGKDAVHETQGNLGADVTKPAAAIAMSVNVPLAIGRACGGQIIGSYIAYQKTQARLERESEEFQFKYDMNKDKAMHEENVKQLELQYSLTQKYGINDRAQRMTPDNAEAFVKCIKSEDKIGVYKQLSYMLKHNESYRYFPMYWCYYATFALEAGQYEDALAACKHFEEVNKTSIFRHDSMAAQIAVTKITAMLATKKIEKSVVKNSLENIQGYNYDCHDVDMACFCATVYNSVLNDSASAIEVLNPLIARLDKVHRDMVNKYSRKYANIDMETEASDNVFPDSSELFRCHLLLKSILATTKRDSVTQMLCCLCESPATASIEKAYLASSTQTTNLWGNLWNNARADVLGIRLTCGYNSDFEKVIKVSIPLSWFFLGDMPVTVDLMQGSNVVGRIAEKLGSRRIGCQQGLRKRKVPYCVEIEMECPSVCQRGIDSCVLHFRHRTWPVFVKFVPHFGDNIARLDGGALEKVIGGLYLWTMLPVSTNIRGKDYELMPPLPGMIGDAIISSELKQGVINPITTGDTSFWSMASHLLEFERTPDILWIGMAVEDKCEGDGDIVKAIQYSTTANAIMTNGFLFAQARNRDYVIAYTNTSTSKLTFRVEATFFTPYGAEIFSATDTREVMANEGGMFQLTCPEYLKECTPPEFVILKCIRERGLWQRVRRWVSGLETQDALDMHNDKRKGYQE